MPNPIAICVKVARETVGDYRRLKETLAAFDNPELRTEIERQTDAVSKFVATSYRYGVTPDVGLFLNREQEAELLSITLEQWDQLWEISCKLAIQWGGGSMYGHLRNFILQNQPPVWERMPLHYERMNDG